MKIVGYFLFLIPLILTACQKGGYVLINDGEYLESVKIDMVVEDECSLYFTYKNNRSIAISPNFMIEMKVKNQNNKVIFFETSRVVEPGETINFSSLDNENTQVNFNNVNCDDIVDLKVISRRYNDFELRIN